MSATMTRQGGRVQLEQSDMRLALSMAKIDNESFWRAAIEETQQLMKKPCAEVRKEKKWGVVFPGLNKVKAVIEAHLAMICASQTDGCLPCLTGTAQNPQTRYRREGTGVPPPRRVPPRPRMPPAPPDDSEITHSSETEGLPPGYVSIRTPLPSA